MKSAFVLFVSVVLYRIVAGYCGGAHPWLWNFSPLAAVALCGPVLFPKRLVLLLPFAVLSVSDLVLNLHFHVAVVTWEMGGRYLALTLLVMMGVKLRDSRRMMTWLLASLSGSIGFYLITNTVSWLTAPDYAKTIPGWWQSLTVGLPGYPPTWLFFRNSLVSDLCFGVMFAGCLVLGTPRKKPGIVIRGSERLIPET